MSWLRLTGIVGAMASHRVCENQPRSGALFPRSPRFVVCPSHPAPSLRCPLALLPVASSRIPRQHVRTERRSTYTPTAAKATFFRVSPPKLCWRRLPPLFSKTERERKREEPIDKRPARRARSRVRAFSTAQPGAMFRSECTAVACLVQCLPSLLLSTATRWPVLRLARGGGSLCCRGHPPSPTSRLRT